MSKPHTLTIRNRTPDQPLTGAKTELLLDGQKVCYARSINLHIEAGDLAIVTLELYANVEVEESVIGRLDKIYIDNNNDPKGE